MSLTTYGLLDLQQIIAAAYGASVGTPADVGEGSQFGPSFNAVALAMLMLQNENIYIDTISRLGSIPDPLPNGTPNPDIDTFINAFGCYRNGPQPASGYETFTIPSPAGVNGYLIPVGTIVSAGGGPTFIVTAGGTGYNASAGGYIITSGNTSVSGLITCQAGGVAGNVFANTITLVIVGPGQPPAGFTCTNPDPFTNGVGTEVGSPLKQRFALFISGGGAGTPNAILAAAYLAQAGLSVSYGDQIKGVKSGSTWTFTPNTLSWFTLVVAMQQGGIWVPATATILNEIINGDGAAYQGIINTIRPAGVSFAVAPPTTLTVDGGGTVFVAPGFDTTSVLAAVGSAYIAFVGNLGLDEYGNAKVCSIMQTLVALAAVPGVLYIDGLTLNGAQNDVTANFGQLLTPGSTAGFVAS